MAEEHKGKVEEHDEGKLIRILGKDLRGSEKLLSGLTKIKGISWAFSTAICNMLNLDKNKKIQELSDEEKESIEGFVEHPRVLSFLKNRRKDFDEGSDKHLLGADLKLQHEFDIKRMKKVKSYKGIRHGVGLPVRGQRTKAHFRKNKSKSGAVGNKKK